ncbi:hypothetical protein ABQD95_20650 [Enterococcus avium]|uniref:hypothetical protein n=1 Tax=Enterococcus avium TaxID=33945 RepID=UPI00163C470B|nr:hypothetical protein [Enterococcus avium]MDT2460385.1 hypothetical protein [Enterococcus avium]
MEFANADKLHRSTSNDQKDQCKHSYTVETLNGSKTGDMVCVHCGDAITTDQYRKMQQS